MSSRKLPVQATAQQRQEPAFVSETKKVSRRVAQSLFFLHERFRITVFTPLGSYPRYTTHSHRGTRDGKFFCAESIGTSLQDTRHFKTLEG